MLVIAALTIGAGEPFDLPWYTIDGGGVMRSASADSRFELSGAIGQPEAGVLTGGDFTLTGGFWFDTPPGDCNADGLVELLDYAGFANCLSGPDELAGADCRCFDVNRDGTVDLRDFAANLNAYRGE
jgi:hypothetical protein